MDTIPSIPGAGRYFLRTNPTDRATRPRMWRHSEFPVGDQIKAIRKLFDAIGVTQIEIDRLEADDVIGILSEKCAAHSWPVTIYSNDQDYLQLMTFGVDILRSANEPKVTEKDVKSKWHCGSDKLLKLRALLGDVSDGIPRAVSGVGPVAAAHYIGYGVDSSIPSFNLLPRHVREHAQRLESYWPTIHMNYRLMRILRSCNDPEMPVDLMTHVAGREPPRSEGIGKARAP